MPDGVRDFGKLNGYFFFKVETSELDPIDSDILAISWQLVDANKDFKIIENKTVYFEPMPDRIYIEAIEINGLTTEWLAELGTMARAEGVDAFAKAWNRAGLVVAHNMDFHMAFIKKNVRNVGATLKLTKGFCTMVDNRVHKNYAMDYLVEKIKVSCDGDIHRNPPLYVEVLKQSFYAISMKARQTCPSWMHM